MDLKHVRDSVDFKPVRVQMMAPSSSSSGLGKSCRLPPRHRPVQSQARARPLARRMPSSATWISGSLSWSGSSLISSPASHADPIVPQVPVKKLYLSAEQEKAIRKVYAQNREYRMRFISTASSQADAENVLYKNGLPYERQLQEPLPGEHPQEPPQGEHPQDLLQGGHPQGLQPQPPQTQPQNKLEHCWLTAWSSTWGSKKGMKKRSLFQWQVFSLPFVYPSNERGDTANSSSGYSTAARQARDKRGSQNPIEWSRQADYGFTGCLAHADVTWNRTSKEIERVIGYFEHNEGCEAAAVILSTLGET